MTKNARGCTALLILLVIAAVFLGGCAESAHVKQSTDKTPALRGDMRYTFPPVAVPEATPERRPDAISDLKVGFIYVGSIGDYGFTYAQNLGRLALMEELGVATAAVENVPEDEGCITAMQSLIDEGCTIIFACSYGFMDYVAQMAEAYPELYFFHCSGSQTRDNLSVYFGRMYQVRYVTGVVAGLRTQTNKIGYVAAFPLPEVVRGANAFALGVKSVNPDAAVSIRWSHTWYDSGAEKALALELIGEGNDVIAQHQDSLMPQIAAEEEGVWGIGYHSPMGFFSKNSYLTGALWNWVPYMVEQVRQIEQGTWQSTNYWGGIEDGTVYLEALTENVAPGTKEAAEEALLRIQNGFDVFEGPVFDNQGRLRIPEGYVLTDEEKLELDWLADNIIGDVNG